MLPVFLKLTGRRVLVVGAGKVAAGKLDALIAAGADLTVVAPDIDPAIERQPVAILRRPFEDADVDGAWYVVAAAPPDVNRQVGAAAEQRRVFVNAVDDPAHATAYLGGVVRRDGVTVAISTDGQAPALAGLLREGIDAMLPPDLDAWMVAAAAARRDWKSRGVPMEQRRPELLERLNQLYAPKPTAGSRQRAGFVSLVGAGPGDPELWTVRALRCVEQADLVLYDALVDVAALQRVTKAQCFCVGKRARRDSVPQETIHKLMIRAARQGKRVVRLKGGDPFVFGRGAEEALALVAAGIPFEVVPGVTTAVAAAELAGIPVTHRGVASAFLVLAGHTSEAVDRTLGSVQPNTMTIVFMMGVAARAGLAQKLLAHGWNAATPAAILCAASTPEAWTWTGTLSAIGTATPPPGLAGVLIVGEVVDVRHALNAAAVPAGADNEVRYVSNR
jgi:uroporphyrin-III C-methyltransferase/precorrin-2 dehydrogenase/sirohydrochlorin ferrochelatase